VKNIAIYKVGTEHIRWGSNWASYTIAARNGEEAVRKAKKEFNSGERLESLQLLASTR